MNDKELNEATLQEIIRRVVEIAQPERIILFGSAVRGEMGPNSDVDLLVIKSGEFACPSANSRLLACRMYGLCQTVNLFRRKHNIVG